MESLQITRSLEINMLTPDTDFRAISNFAIKHRVPALVIAPEFAPMVLTDRSAKSGQYQIIAAIDFPDGKNFCLDKFNTLDVMSLEVDGMDILLTRGKTEIEARNEVKALTEFLKGSVNPTLNIRYVYGYYTREWPEIENLLKATEAHPPHAIRLDQHLELPNVDLERHVGAVKKLKEKTPKPIKVSGNVDLATIEGLLKIDNRIKFDVTIKQATSILTQLQQRNQKEDADA
jgi:hypothetical protein